MYCSIYQTKSQEKAHRSGLWLFLLRGISYPRRLLGGQSELFVVCIYGFCVYGRAPSFYAMGIATKVTSTPRVLLSRAVHSVTCCPVETMQAHQKHIVKSLAKTSKRQGDRSFEYTPQYACGGPGGFRTPVQNTFLFASYSNNYYLSPSFLSDPMLDFLHPPR